MLEQIREGSQGFLAKAILVIIALTFVLAGIGSYISTDINQTAVEVNGDEISLNAVEQAYQSERARLQNQFGDAFSQLASNDEYMANLRQSVVERLIGDKLIEQQAKNLGLRVSEEQIKQAILAAPEFQIGGNFSNERYLALIRQSGFTSADFQEYMRTDMTRRQVAIALTASEFALPGESTQVLALQQQTRDGRFLQINATSFVDDVVVSDEEIKNYYETNLASFDTQEQVKLSYIEVRSNDLKAEISVSDEEISQYYQDNLDSYQTEEERRASHILVEFGDDEDAAEAKITALLARVKSGEDFAELAKAESEDVVSAELGGDLDWFSKGAFDPEFEEAVFALENINDVTDVVKSAFGFHVIKLTGVKPGSVQPLEEVTATIKTQLTQSKASEAFFSLTEELEQVAFESPDDLVDVAQIAKVEIQKTDLFDRQSAPLIFNQPTILDTIFDPDFIDEGLNSEVIEVGSEHVVVLRIDEYEAERTQSLEEVKDSIVSILNSEKAQAAAREWALTIKDDLINGADVQEKLDTKAVTWTPMSALGRFANDVPAQVTDELFKLSTGDDAESLSVIDVNFEDVALVQLEKINTDKAVESSQIVAASERMAQQLAQSVYVELIDALKQNADIKQYN